MCGREEKNFGNVKLGAYKEGTKIAATPKFVRERRQKCFNIELDVEKAGK